MNTRYKFGEFLKEYKLFVQRIGLAGLTNILISLSSLILIPVLTKTLTIESYGVWNLFITTISFIPLLTNLGLPYTMVRFLAVEKEKKDIQEGFYSITLVLLIIGLITSLILLLISKEVAMILFEGNTIISSILAICVLVSMNYISFSSFFRTFQQIKILSILSLVQTYLMVVAVMILVELGYSIEGAVFGYFIVQLIVTSFSIIFVFHEIGFKAPKFKRMKEYLSFGIPTVPGNLSSWMVDLSDRYVIGIFLGTAFVGYYSPGYTLGNVIMMFGSPFVLLLPPLLSVYYDQKKMEDVTKHLQYSIKYLLLLSIPSVFGLSILSKSFLTLLSNPEIAQNGYLITPFIAFSALILSVQGIISQILALEKKTKIIGSRWIMTAFINVILNIIFVPLFGIIAAAISTLIAYAFSLATTMFYTQKYIKISFDIRFILKSIFASIVMSVLIKIINPLSSFGIIITVGICFGVYIIIILATGGINKNEIEFFKEFLKKS